ncbi:hypothetical protein DFR29_12244 [Tahibacter aquaticus]|uniref:Uncharacterized protein n=1 Tax=Tahibacter aquaticus TaxID=520092 RepID=A0A4R6YLT7_9GAMM|nr:hypothetical protein [Tahibacter aquaticus]TDR38244.1 hypothetical protein DFR29_12244 [Tahibacter aquaticus]
MSETLHSPGVLALELSAGSSPNSLTLSRDQADELARHIADDLARLLPATLNRAGAVQADLLVLGAFYDHVQLLRPGWPLWAQLAELVHHGQVLRDAGERRIVAFGSFDGAMPSAALQPESGQAPGAMLLLPWMFSADEALASALGARMENVFMASGEAGSHTADFLMRTLGVQLEHARYLTRHDLCALTCAQMEHAGFSALWQMLEFGLLYPQRDGEAETSRGRKLYFRAGRVHCALPLYADWLAEQGQDADAAERATGYAGWLFELRQYTALLRAHGLSVIFDGNDGDDALLLQHLADSDAALPPPQLYAHEARGLGIVAISVAQARQQGEPRLLAHAWPLDKAALESGVSLLVQRYGAVAALNRLGRIGLDATAEALAVPGSAHSVH